MGPRDRKYQTWMETCLVPRYEHAISATLTCLCSERTTQLACSSIPSVARYDGRTCHLWATRCVFKQIVRIIADTISFQSSRYIAGCFYTDTSGLFEAQLHTAAGTNGVDTATTSTIQGAVNSDKRSQWLILVRPQGIMEVRCINIIILRVR